jgi:glycosyltransferase involved in cell wall biosynthesis
MAEASAMQGKPPCVSVIVTTYKRAKLLAETLDSIMAQTYTDFELIVVDNLSEDGTGEYVSSITDPRVRYFRNANHGVIAVNRNYGIRQAKGRYIAFCDDDDLWLSDKLEQQVKLLEQHVEVALCYTQAESFLGDQILATRMNRRQVRTNHFFQLLRGNFFPNSSVLIRREVFEELGMLTEDASLREDYEMWLRVARRHRLMGIEASLIRYRVHPSNVAGNRAAETLRAIRTVKSVVNKLDIPQYLVWPNIGFQFLKYLFYRMASR